MLLTSLTSHYNTQRRLRSDAIVYFVVSPLEGPGYRTCDEDELQAISRVHAFERLLARQSYWFVHLGQIGVKHHDCGFTFRDSDLAQLPAPPEKAWETVGVASVLRQELAIEPMTFRTQRKDSRGTSWVNRAARANLTLQRATVLNQPELLRCDLVG
jgi:hypothetical protein